MIKYLLLLFMIITVSIQAQNTNPVLVRDLESWSSVGVNYKVSDAFSLKLKEELRLNSNSSSVDQLFTNFEATVKAANFLSFSGGMRYIHNKSNSGDFENHFRFNFDVDVKHDWERFTFNYRLRLQSKNEIGISTEEGDYPQNGQRLKAGFKYNFKDWKFDPIFSTEIFRESGKYILPSFNKIRFTLGTDYKVKKIGEIGLFYRIERELGVTYPMTTHIIGANFTFKLKAQ